MGWSHDWSSSPSPAVSLALVNEFMTAVRQRDAIVAGAPTGDFTDLAAEDIAQDGGGAGGDWPMGWIYKLQAWVELNYMAFVKPRGEAGYDGEADQGYFGDLADLFSEAGLGHEDWRRYTVHPADGGEVAYGRAEAADVAGTWLFHDLQAVLNVLIETAHTASWYAQGETNDFGGAANDVEGWAAAKAAAEADWSGGTLNESPAAWTYGVDRGGTPQLFNAELHRTAAYAYVLGVWDGVERAVDWYFASEKIYAPFVDTIFFDANGDDVLEDQLSHWLTDADPAGTAFYSSTKLGTTAKPAWCAEPTGGHSIIRGYQKKVTSPADVVIRWTGLSDQAA